MHVGEALGMVAFPAFVLTSFLLGARLLAMASQTRELPELAIGLNFVVAGGIGYTLLILAESLRVLPPGWAGIGSFAGVTAISLGSLLIAEFSRRVFRPDSELAKVALGAITVALLLGIVGSWVLHVAGETRGLGVWLGRWVPNLGIFVAYGWASCEPLRFAVLMRRRARIGFGDPLIANRMLLWSIGTGAIAGVALLHLVAQLFGRYELPAELVGVVSSLVLVTALTEWLAFFPPRAYVRRFEAKSA